MSCSRINPFWPISSRRPRNGLIKDAPALAAKIACAAEKQSVTFTLIPSRDNCCVAFSPSRVRGHFTTTFGAIFEYSRPSRNMPSVSRLVTSAETGPCTISQIAAMCCLKSTPPSLAMRDGLVVTPSARPNELASRISFRLAVSIKNFIKTSPAPKCGACQLVQRIIPDRLPDHKPDSLILLFLPLQLRQRLRASCVEHPPVCR